MADVSVHRVTKRFPGVVALDDVSLTFHAGEIHVLLGENGAGKSTLMGLLAGMQQPDSGEILIDGRHTVIDSPRRSMDLGVGAVFQQLLLVQSLTVLENLMLGGRWWRSLQRAAALRRFEELRGSLGLHLDPDAPVTALSLGQQQQVEIMRALWREEKLLLLDEPTSMLTPQGVQDLGVMMGRLKAKGVALVLVTHKLLEAFQFGDRISVLRQGRVAGDIAPGRLATMSSAGRTAEVLQLMFGTTAGEGAGAGTPDRGAGAARRIDRTVPPTLRVHGLGTDAGPGEVPLNGVTFEVWPGEVIGIAGVDGNGQKHLAEALAGQRTPRAGRIELGSTDVTHGRVPERRRGGIRYVTDDRLGEGTVGGLSVAINLNLKDIGTPPHWRRGITDWRMIHESARRQIQAHDIRTPSERTPIGKLSGGNIQKVLLARELSAEARVAILNKPTHGLDLQNQRLTLERIGEAAARGVALIVISTDLDELLAISDRIGVMFQGHLAGIVDNDRNAEHAVGALMTGATLP